MRPARYFSIIQLSNARLLFYLILVKMQVFFAGLQLKYNSSIIEEICLIQEEK